MVRRRPVGPARWVGLCVAGVLGWLPGGQPAAQAPQKITIAYPTRSGASWPLYIAKQGGYYAKHGLDVTLAFGVHPASIAMLVSGEAQMANQGLELAMNAAVKDGSLVVLGSSLNKGLMSLIARKEIASGRDLKGRRIGVGRIGDTPYHYTVSLIEKFGLGPRDVQWVPSGADAQGRAAGLMSGAVDAALLTTPSSFRLEEAGFRNLGGLGDYDDIFVSTTYLFTKRFVAANPTVPERIIKAHAEAIKRFYDDKAFAVQAYVAHDKQDVKDIERVYDLYVRAGALERVPYVPAGAVQSAIVHADPINATQMKAFDFRTVIDNGVVRRLAAGGYFDGVFGPSVKGEAERKAKAAF